MNQHSQLPLITAWSPCLSPCVTLRDTGSSQGGTVEHCFTERATRQRPAFSYVEFLNILLTHRCQCSVIVHFISMDSISGLDTRFLSEAIILIYTPLSKPSILAGLFQ